jgi:hypothetical protein
MADYEDDWTEHWRANGSLIKGRFLNGNVAYVAREDLALYAAAFRRSMRDPMPLPARRVLDLLRRHGPMLMSTLRDQTGLERGRFNRALMALNQAFEVMKIQHTLDWNSPWDLFRRAYPEADLEKWEQVQAQESVLPPNDPLALPQWSLILQRFRNERLPYCLGVIVEDGEIVGAAWGH